MSQESKRKHTRQGFSPWVRAGRASGKSEIYDGTGKDLSHQVTLGLKVSGLLEGGVIALPWANATPAHPPVRSVPLSGLIDHLPALLPFPDVTPDWLP